MFKKLLYQSLFQNLLKQGGNAVANVQRIQQENIIPTVNVFLSKIIKPLYNNLTWDKDIFLLGSTGKKSSSGDIDIGIDFNKIKQSNQTIMDQLKKLFIKIYESGLCEDIKINQITNDMIHISFPQYNKLGQRIGKNVQIDILLTPFKDFCRFYMYSPSEQESKYKGAHRNELLRAIIKVLTFKPLQYLNNELVRWKQYDLNSQGLCAEQKTLIDNYGNKLKYKDTNQDLIPAYAKVIKSKFLTHNPNVVIKVLVGDIFKQKDIDSFQKLFKIIQLDPYFKYDDKRFQILQETAISIRENNKLQFPDQLIQYLPKS